MRKTLIILLTAAAMLSARTISAQPWSVRLNMLGLLTGTVDAGAEVALGEHWSLDLSAY